MTAAVLAYENTGKTLAQGRVAEALAFSKAARLLEDARTHPGDAAKLREALRVNGVVWTAVQAEITAARSTLPRQLRAGRMSLSLFVDRVTEAARAGQGLDQIQALIDINRDVAAGLMETR